MISIPIADVENRHHDAVEQRKGINQDVVIGATSKS